MVTTKVLIGYFIATAAYLGVNKQPTEFNFDEIKCLTENIYHEARGESIQGQFAVASATINRVKDSRYPSTVCGVVKQSTFIKSTNKEVCAFSWYCDKDKRNKDISVQNKDGTLNYVKVDQIKTAAMVSIKTLYGNHKDITYGATHFHNPALSNPAWASTLKPTVKLGNHNFYRLPIRSVKEKKTTKI